MSLDLFRIALGLDLVSDDQLSSAAILFGTGAPGADAAEQDAAPIGSLYLRTDLDTDELQLYYKFSIANNTAADWHQPASKVYADGLTSGLQTEVDAIETAVGLQPDGTLGTPFSGTTYLSGDTTIIEALLGLDVQANLIQIEVDNIEAAAGAAINTDGTFNSAAFGSTNFISTSTDLTDALIDLDTQAQVLVDTKVNRAGDTMDVGANLIFQNGEVLGLPAVPSGGTAAASKAYVDAQAGGVTWIDPAWYVDLVRDDVGNGLTGVTLIRDLQTPANDTGEIAGAENSDMYIIGPTATTITLRAVGVTGTITDIGPLVAGTVVRLDTDDNNGQLAPTWQDKGHITTYFEESTEGEHSKSKTRWNVTTLTGVAAGGSFVGLEDCMVGLVKYDPNGSGTADYDSLWGVDYAQGDLETTPFTTVADSAGSLNNTYFTINAAIGNSGLFDTLFYVWYNVNAAGVDPIPGGTGIEVALATNDTASAVASATKIAVDSFWGGSLWRVDAVADALTFTDQHYGNVTDATVGTSGFTLGTITAGSLTATPVEGDAFYVSNPDSMNFGKQFVYVAGTTNNWVEFGASATVVDGTGLSFSGNVLNANLGAGIIELPSDEIGVDVYSTGGLITTLDGVTSDTGTAARLAISLDGTTLSLSAGGLRIHADVIAEIDAIETSVGLNADGTRTAPAGTNYIDTSTDLMDADVLLDTQIGTNATDISNLQAEVDLIETSMGAVISTTGAYVPHTLSNYINGNADLTADLMDLDAQIKANADDIVTLFADTGDEPNIRAFIGKTGSGVEAPTYSSNDIVTAATDLESAIGEIDAAIGTLQFTNDFNISDYLAGVNDVTAALDGLDTAIGDRTYTAGNVVTSADAIATSIDGLSVAIGSRDYTNTINHILNVDGESITASLEKLNIGIGSRNYTDDNVVVDGQSITDSIDALDQAVGNASAILRTVVPSGGIFTVCDTVAITTADIVKWIISVEDDVDPTKRITQEVHAGTDGTNADHTIYGRVKSNGNIAGLGMDVVVNGGNMEIQVRSTGVSHVAVKRVAAYLIRL